MSQKIDDFLKLNYNAEAQNSLTLLEQSGSSRKYYRFQFENQSYILTESENIEENKTFIYFTNHFSRVIDNLPEILKISSDYNIYTQNDLGNQSLLNLLETDRENAKTVFLKAVKQLVRLQVLGDRGLDYSRCFSYPKFNHLLVLRDLFSFKNYSVNLLNLEFNHGRLMKDFENFAGDFEAIRYQYFVYRDFQSRNIMVKNGEPFFIDYQGGVKGPPQYDLVSLIWQARAHLPKEWKEELYTVYLKEFIDTTQRDVNSTEFQRAYELCLIERLLQVLGTYGFRGIYERKPHFLISIKFALANLREIRDLEVLKNYPELKTIMEELSLPQTYEIIKKRIDG